MLLLHFFLILVYMGFLLSPHLRDVFLLCFMKHGLFKMAVSIIPDSCIQYFLDMCTLPSCHCCFRYYSIVGLQVCHICCIMQFVLPSLDLVLFELIDSYVLLFHLYFSYIIDLKTVYAWLSGSCLLSVVSLLFLI